MSHISPVSVIISTRNRGDSIINTITSVLRNSYPNYQVLIVDQSTNDLTEKAIELSISDARLRYLRSDTVGAGRARNLALTAAIGEFLLITDDDCSVPGNWINELVAIFQANPKVGVVFSSVEPANYDPAQGIIPYHRYRHSRVRRSVADYVGAIGMGAGMSIRRQVLDQVGLLDETMGPGAPLGSAEDLDFAIRALISGWWICETPNVSVTHHGFRSHAQFLQVVRRDWLGIGAVHSKLIKAEQPEGWPLLWHTLIIRLVLQPLSAVRRWRRPQGAKRLLYYFEGLIRGWQTPIDRKRIVYRIPGDDALNW